MENETFFIHIISGALQRSVKHMKKSVNSLQM